MNAGNTCPLKSWIFQSGQVEWEGATHYSLHQMRRLEAYKYAFDSIE